MDDDFFDLVEQERPEEEDEGHDYGYINPKIVREDDGSFHLTFTLGEEAIRRAKYRDEGFEASDAMPILARYDALARTLKFFPTIVSPDSSRFLRSKYAVHSITLEDQDPDRIVFSDDSQTAFEDLPTGFIHDARQGFGLLPKNRLIMAAIGRIPNLHDLTLTDHPKTAGLVGASLRMTFNDFDHHRRAIQRSHAAAIKVVNADKEVYLYNEIVSPIDPVKYPPKPLPYQKDALQRAVGRSLMAPGTISRGDQRTAVRIVKSEVRAIAEKDETELLELSREIEVVSLEVVIAKMTTMLGKNHDEADWQRFLSANPFILRLAFGLPIMVFGEQVSVGGIRFDNKGGKLADFIVKSGGFGNLAIIEIKRPDTDLVEQKAYRRGVHAPSKDLAGGVAQVIDQRYMLAREIDSRKVNSHEHDVWNYAVKCYVIAGRTITDPDKFLQEAKRKSFEFYRHSLVDVTVITFDELLEKLNALLLFLSPPEGENWRPFVGNDDII